MYLCKNLIYPSSHKITFARRYVKTNLNILSEISMYAVLRGRWKKYNICFDDQITDHWIKNDIAPPMCVFPRGGRQSPALKTIENNSKQWPLSETLQSIFCKRWKHFIMVAMIIIEMVKIKKIKVIKKLMGGEMIFHHATTGHPELKIFCMTWTSSLSFMGM